MSGDDLAHAIADGRERYAAAKADQFGMGYASVNLGNWVLANLPAVLDAASRSLPPPAGQDERVREMARLLRQRAELQENSDEAALDRDAADLLESTAARLAATDALIAEMWSGYYPCSEMKDGLFDMWGTTKDRAIERHRARTSRARTTGEGTW